MNRARGRGSARLSTNSSGLTSNSEAPVLSHADAHGKARMVDVTPKSVTVRTATAAARVVLSAIAYDAVINNTLAKGDVLGVARIAGILAAKRCDEIIPLCHTLPLTGIEVKLHPTRNKLTCAIEISATITTAAQTGVEMEALLAVSIAALTVIDMIKALDRGASVQDVRVTAKSGGKSGDWVRDESGELVQSANRALPKPRAKGAQTRP
jgi:cyclic pyranopterin phosphate synthase